MNTPYDDISGLSSEDGFGFLSGCFHRPLNPFAKLNETKQGYIEKVLTKTALYMSLEITIYLMAFYITIITLL